MRHGDQTDQLFTALADQLKIPLLQIVRLSELAHPSTLPRISIISEHALRLVDAYVQTTSQNQLTLPLEPVTTGAVLYEVATTLEPFAKQLGYTIELDQQGKAVPVMAHHQSLRTMLTLLGASLIEAGSEQEDSSQRLVLGAHRSAKGTVIGAFSQQVAMSQRALQLTRELHGRASQAVPSLGQSGGAGLAIADLLSVQMAAPLKAYRHRSMTGIGALLMPSRQLQLW